MKYTQLPLLFLGLIGGIIHTFWQFLLYYLRKYQSLFLATVLFLIIIVFLQFGQVLNVVKPQNEQLLAKKESLEYWLEKQPTHRDILFNLSKIETQLGNKDQAEKYLNRAKQLDPNHASLNVN